MIGEGSILDVGCGDLEVFAPLPATNYTGVDISEQALSIARLKRPEWSFETAERGRLRRLELRLRHMHWTCLIHQPSKTAARRSCKIWRAWRARELSSARTPKRWRVPASRST